MVPLRLVPTIALLILSTWLLGLVRRTRRWLFSPWPAVLVLALLWPAIASAQGVTAGTPSGAVDVGQFLTVGGLSVLLGLIVQFLVKPSIPIAQVALIPWVAVALGIVLAIVFGIATGAGGGQQLASLAVTGLLAGLSSVGLYQASLNNVASMNKQPPGK